MDKNRNPNILFILSDQHRFCDMGCAGNGDVNTPNMDRMAQDGAYFTAAYSNCPLCVPARGSLLTGLHGLKHGAAANDLPVIPTTPSIADVLNDAGYETAYIGKWHLAGAPRDQFVTHYNRLGFRYWRGHNCNHNYLAGYYDDNNNVRHEIKGYAPIGETDLALEFLEHREEQEKPFAMFLSYGPPHDPYYALPDGDLERLQNRPLRLRGNCLTALEPGELIFYEYDPLKIYAGYYAHIERIDEQIGRVTAWLKEHGIYENTIVVYTSDHGDMLGSHGYMNKQLYFDESARIPFLITWPGHIEPGIRKQPLSIIDMAPSVLGLTGHRFQNKTDGKDLSEAMRRPDANGQEYVYLYSYVPCHQAERRKIPSWRAVTNGVFTYVADQAGRPVSLFDMDKDPLQMKDIKEEPEYREQRNLLENRLKYEVEQQDGFIPWEDLLDRYGLEEIWVESEIYFTGVFTRCMNAERKLEQLAKRKRQKKERLGV